MSNPSLALVKSLTLNSIPSSSPKRFSITMILWVLLAIPTSFPKLSNLALIPTVTGASLALQNRQNM
ncbi:hypothetical protein PanWU01x14_187540 [Parasponia andersonii]|uniref:Uncharacterized protein n=1 Tax=Parasponia andersonii TaxID=3476 RepID=A0A2P5C3M5_PARAD|nr:hypothetical protein PanWU01x14_187540 [Parasponia andersonii]